jgi:hypothetical protein
MALALPQAQASNLPNEVGEERCTADVVNKIIKTKTTQLTPPSQLSASPMQTSYPHVPNEPTWALEAERHIHNVAMNRKEETSVEQHSQEGSVGYTPIPLPTHQAQDPPALPKQAMPIRKPPDEVPLTIKMTPERREPIVISHRCPASDEHSPKTKTAQGQSKAIVVPSRGIEGVYLARAVAYIQERLSKHSPVRNMSPPGDMPEEPPSRVTEVEAGQRVTDVSEGTTNITGNTPCSKAAAVLPILSLARPTWINLYHKPTSEPRRNHYVSSSPSMSIAPACPNNDPLSNKVIAQPKGPICCLERFEDVGRRPDQMADNKMNEGTLMPCSMEYSPSRTVEIKTGYSCTNVVSKKTMSTTERSPHAIMDPTLLILSPDCPTQATLMPCSPRDEPLAPSTSVSPASPNNDLISHKIIEANSSSPSEKSQEIINRPTTSITPRSPNVLAQPTWSTMGQVLCTEAAHQLPGNSHEILLTRSQEDEDKQPKQATISETVNSACWHSQESIAAPMLPTSEPISRPPAYPSCLSPEHEKQLRWKPPDCGKSTRRRVFHVINERLRLSAAFPWPVVKPAPPQVHLDHLTFVWRTSCVLFNMTDISQRRHDEVVSKWTFTGVERSPVPSQEAECRLLEEAVNKAKRRQQRGHLPVPWPLLALLVCPHMLTPMRHMAQLASMRAVNTHRMSMELARRAHKLPDMRARLWLQFEAVNKNTKERGVDYLLLESPSLACASTQ